MLNNKTLEYIENQVLERVQRIRKNTRRKEVKPGIGLAGNIQNTDWDNPDNIGYGLLGELFFLLELYRTQSEPDLLTTIDRQLEVLEDQLQNHPTNNYTFYYGRAGLIQFYVDIYRTTGARIYLDKALESTREYQQHYAELFALSGSSSLFDGISGLLLTFMSLFEVSQEQWLLPLIEDLTLRLIKNARIHPDGAYWNGIATESVLQNVGYAYGNAGIAYAFLRLGAFFDNPAFYYLSDLALRFEEGFYTKPSALWRQLSAAGKDSQLTETNYRKSLPYGMAGSLISILEYDQLLEEGQSTAKRDKAMLETTNLLKDLQADRGSVSTLQIDWGISCLEAFHRTGQSLFREYAEKLVKALLVEPQEGGLKEGYFLAKYLQLHNGCYQSGFLFPDLSPDGGLMFENLNLESPLFFDVSEINELLLRNSFTESYSKIAQHFPEELESFCRRARPNIYADFRWEVDPLLRSPSADGKPNKLRLAFEKDCFMIGDIFPAILSTAEKELITEDELAEVVRDIRLSDEAFSQLAFRHSSQVWFLQFDPVIPLDKVFSYDEVSDLVSDYGGSSFVFYRAPSGLEEQRLLVSKLILDRFRYATSISDMQQDFYRFLSRQIPEVINIIDMGLEDVAELDLEEKSRQMIIRSVRYLYEEGILERVAQQ